MIDFLTWTAIFTVALCLYAGLAYTLVTLATKFATFVARKFRDAGL